MFGDIQSRRLLVAKAILFAVLGTIAVLLVIAEDEAWREAVFLVVAIWAFCRLYYFFFYVIENYMDEDRRYSGLWNALSSLLKRQPTKREKS